jgi:hypothetical protein
MGHEERGPVFAMTRGLSHSPGASIGLSTSVKDLLVRCICKYGTGARVAGVAMLNKQVGSFVKPTWTGEQLLCDFCLHSF